MDEKLKAKTCKKEQFSMFMLYFESNQGMQTGVENGAMLTTFRYTYSARGIDPLTKILRTFLYASEPCHTLDGLTVSRPTTCMCSVAEKDVEDWKLRESVLQ